MVRRAALMVIRLLRVPRTRPVVHHELEHAHWDREARRWFTHSDEEDAQAA